MGTNLLSANAASFDTDASAWEELYGSIGFSPTCLIDVVSSPSQGGTKSLRVTKQAFADSAGNQCVVVLLPFTIDLGTGKETGGLAVTPGETYTALASIYGEGDVFVDFTLSMSWRNSTNDALGDDGTIGGSVSSTVVGPGGTNGAWAQSVQTKVAPVGAAAAFITLNVSMASSGSAAPVGAVAYVSKVSLAVGSDTIWTPGSGGGGPTPDPTSAADNPPIGAALNDLFTSGILEKAWVLYKRSSGILVPLVD